MLRTVEDSHDISSSYKDNDLPIDHTFHLDKFIESFETFQKNNPGCRTPINVLDCRALCIIMKKVLLSQDIILDLQAPIKVCGDLHGQVHDMMRIFDLCGHPSNQKYLFLGDYVDRGFTSVDVISMLFAYKLKYPNNIHLLRGNHESICINRVYGFKKEINERFNSSKAWKSFNVVFSTLPIAAIIDNSIFCCHGGISPEFLLDKCTDIRATIREILRPTEVPQSGVMCDLLWADPMDLETNSDTSSAAGWISNTRGCSYSFGVDVIEAFLDKFKLDLIVRAHQVVADGYEFYCDGSLVTIFSASNYCGTFDNAAGVFNLEPNEVQLVPNEVTLNGGFHILPPDKNIKNQWVRAKKKDPKTKQKSDYTAPATKVS